MHTDRGGCTGPLPVMVNAPPSASPPSPATSHILAGLFGAAAKRGVRALAPATRSRWWAQGARKTGQRGGGDGSVFPSGRTTDWHGGKAVPTESAAGEGHTHGYVIRGVNAYLARLQAGLSEAWRGAAADHITLQSARRTAQRHGVHQRVVLDQSMVPGARRSCAGPSSLACAKRAASPGRESAGELDQSVVFRSSTTARGHHQPYRGSS